MGRIDRVNQQLKREISGILQRELGDPRLEFVSITYVRVSRDLRHARIYFSVFGGQQEQEGAKQALDNASGLIRKYVGQRIRMRYTPQLSFFYDESIEFNSKIDETLREIHDGIQEDYTDIE